MILFVYIVIPLFNSSIWLLDGFLSVLDKTVDNEQEGEWEHCVLKSYRFQPRQNKSPASYTSAKKKNLSADALFEKCLDQPGRYIGRPLIHTRTHTHK